GAQLAEVLDNTVMHDDGPPAAADVRVRVAWAGHAVRRPARVPDPDPAIERRVTHPLEQVAQLAHIAPDRDLIALHDGDPRRVVAAIFQALQAGQNDRRCVARANVSNDSTHSISSQGTGAARRHTGAACQAASVQQNRVQLDAAGSPLPCGSGPRLPVVFVARLRLGGERSRAVVCALAASAEASIFPRLPGVSLTLR